MTSKEIVDNIREEFFKKIDAKPTWGRQSIKELFILSVTDSLLKTLSSNDESTST